MIRLSYLSEELEERTTAFEGDVVRFGTDTHCEIRLVGGQIREVAARHGSFVREGDTYHLLASDAVCRLWLNGEPFQRRQLHGGERIRVGSPEGPEIRVVQVNGFKLLDDDQTHPIELPSAQLV